MKPWPLLGAIFCLGAPDAVAACGAQLPEPARQMVQGATPAVAYEVVFAPSPWPIVVGQHFALDFEICPRSGAALPTSVRVDADMPVHRHGMNYRATVKALGEGRFRAEGLMFHMPGQWRLMFDVSGGVGLVRLSSEIDVQ